MRARGTWVTTEAASSRNSATRVDRQGTYGTQTKEGTINSTFGYLGELYDPWGLLYMRDRWYDPGYGFFYGRDRVRGNVQQPMSFNPYQYAFDNPLMYTDRSGQCIGWVKDAVSYAFGGDIDGECRYQGWSNPNWQDARPWGGAAADLAPGLGDVKGLIEVLTGCDLITGEDLGWWRYAGLIPILGTRGRAVLREAHYADELLEAVEHYGDDLIDVERRLGIRHKLGMLDAEAFWQKVHGRILSPEEYPPSPFPTLEQPTNQTCLPTCLRMSNIGLRGQDDLLEELHALVEQAGGTEFDTVEPYLRQRGWNVEVRPRMSTRDAMQTIYAETQQGNAVLVGVDAVVSSMTELMHTPLIGIVWYTFPFDRAMYEQLVRICPNILWLIPSERVGPHTTRIGGPGNHLPCPALSWPFDLEEAIILITWGAHWMPDPQTLPTDTDSKAS